MCTLLTSLKNILAISTTDKKHWTVGKIQESMKALGDASKKYQDELIDQRARGDDEKINLYQPGDFVLAQSREKMN